MPLRESVKVNAVEHSSKRPCKFPDKGWLRPDGYGMMWLGKRKVRVHIHALEQKLGRPLLPGMKALHTCDVRNCIEEEHLYEGTDKQNVADCIARGRFKGFGQRR